MIPYIKVLPLGEMEYVKAKRFMLTYNLKPSDAIHLAVMDNHGISTIITEDKDFDKTHVKRIWLK